MRKLLVVEHFKIIMSTISEIDDKYTVIFKINFAKFVEKSR